MNTFENELSVKNLAVLLACKEEVDAFYLDPEDSLEIRYGSDGALTHIDGPVRVLVIYD